MKKFLNRIFDKLGYVTKSSCEMRVKIEKNRYDDQLRKIENIQIEKLVTAIMTVNMVKAVMDWNGISTAFHENGVPNSVNVEYKHPPKPNWYVIKFALDVAKLQRIHQDMYLTDNSPEYDFFKRSILFKIEHDMDALMKLHGVIK